MRLFVSATAISLLAACAQNNVRQVEELHQSIVHGAPDTSHEAVVALHDNEGLACTGALVGPSFVLTAAHCLAGLGIEEVHIGVDAFAPDRTVGVARVHRPSDFDLETLRNDIALIELAQPVMGIEPLAVSLSETPDIQEMLTVVGYGRAANDADAALGGSGERRIGTAIVSAIDTDTLTLTAAPSQPCEGDSGGPILSTDDSRWIVAVISHGDPLCQRAAVGTTAAAFAGFLKPYLQAPAPQDGCSVVQQQRPVTPWLIAICLAAWLFVRRRAMGAKANVR